MALSKFVTHQSAINTGLLVFSLIFGIGYGFHLYPITGWPTAMLYKGLGVGLLVLFTLTRNGMQTGAKRLLSLALFFGFLGDILLEGPMQNSFLMGLGGFLVGHLFYMALFKKAAASHKSTMAKAIVAILWLSLIITLVQIYPLAGDLAMPVLVYGVILTSMATLATFSQYALIFVSSGAILFLISDMLLGLRLFMDLPASVGPLIWFTYYPAQLLLCLGVIRGSE